jgi:hypothetical protein
VHRDPNKGEVFDFLNDKEDLDGFRSYYTITWENDKSEISFNLFDWGHILELALHYGWTPMGTKPSDLTIGEHWEGGYTSNDYQIVISEDATNLGKALEKALTDIPDIDLGGTFNNGIEVNGDNLEDIVKAIYVGVKLQRGLSEELLLKKFSGKASKKYIRKFIDFCNEGNGFIIS